MNCPIGNEETAELLLAYTARRLDASKAALLESHMDVCPECGQFRAGQQMVWQALEAWEAPSVTPDFNRRLYRRIETEAAAPWYRRLLNTPLSVWKPAFPLAAAGLLVAAAFVWDHPGASPAPNAPSAIRVSVTEAEQVENTLDDLRLLRQLDNSATSPPSESM